MKRQFLEDLGLTKEQVDAIITEYGNSVNSKNAKLESLTKELDAAKETIGNLEKNSTDNESMQKELNDYKTKIADLEKASLEQKRNYKLKEVLQGAKAKNIDVIMPLLSDINFDGEKFDGLDEKIKSLKENNSTSFLFETEQKPPLSTGGTHSGTDEVKLGEFERELAKLNPNIKF